MKLFFFLLFAVFIIVEDVQSFSIFKKTTEHYGSSPHDQLQRLQSFSEYSSLCAPGARTSGPSNNKNRGCKSSSSRQEKQQQRFRRSFAYKTQCFPVKKMACQTFKFAGIKKKICIEYDHVECTALD